MRHIVDNVNKLELTFKTIDLEGRIPGTDPIEFLSVEEPYREGRRYSPFVRVRYALNGVKQDKAFPMDVDKGIFLSIDDDILEERLRPIAPKIVEILQEHAMQQNVERKDSIRMTLKEHIEDISNQLKQNAFPNEAAVSFGIVLRLLEALGWPKFTPKVIIPEYAVEGQRVDFALCNPPGKPLVFVEVKQVGNLDGAEEQLFGYAFRRGVPIAILTDGQKWRFFYPIGQGDFRERKVYELDLIENNSEENSARLNRYLNYEAVQTGETVKAIEEDYKNVSQQRQIERRLPEAWSKLLQDEDEFLLETMIDKTESLCGAKPTTEQVLTFLKSLERKTVSDRKENSSYSDPNSRSKRAYRASSTTRKHQQTLIVTMPDGTKIDHHNAAQTFVEVIVQEVIEKLSPEEVTRIYPTIISTTPFPPDRVQQQHGQFHINLKNGTLAKKQILEKIANRIDINLQIDVVDKQ